VFWALPKFDPGTTFQLLEIFDFHDTLTTHVHEFEAAIEIKNFDAVRSDLGIRSADLNLSHPKATYCDGDRRDQIHEKQAYAANSKFGTTVSAEAMTLHFAHSKMTVS
jgi:hypothetical protein